MRHANKVLGIVALVLLSPAFYVGAYLGVVKIDRNQLRPCFTDDDGVIHFQRDQSYRLGGSAARAFFWPANEIDRRIRYDYWASGPATWDTET